MVANAEAPKASTRSRVSAPAPIRMMLFIRIPCGGDGVATYAPSCRGRRRLCRLGRLCGGVEGRRGYAVAPALPHDTQGLLHLARDSGRGQLRRRGEHEGAQAAADGIELFPALAPVQRRRDILALRPGDELAQARMEQ